MCIRDRYMGKSKNSKAFSIDIPLILLTANILRICFWFGKFFETALLVQSVFMIILQFVLLHACVKYDNQLKKIESNVEFFSFYNFWRWGNYINYVNFIIIFTIFAITMTTASIYHPFLVEIIGLLSLCIEACLPMPQFYKNVQTKNTSGLSYAMIGCWFFGDLSKLIYYIFKNQPFQFIMCGLFQLFIDSCIVIQIRTYGKNKFEI
eukprot:TRINITY_DN1738_c0_g1_i1.p1 TRINITY_DN1738_c0_g1~~TRINITY_DN1738_c0_g1_i1.p1  ORF type:complete len:207 (+),score=15.58 TRINITY_DN1738_c0_g1_i1:103-723(+)